MFWDSSALVPLVIDEESTTQLTTLAGEDANLIVSFITPLEVESAVWRRVRADANEIARTAALQRVRTLAERWTVLGDVEATLSEARRMVERHHLRASDAIQLAAALLIGEPSELTIVTKDDELIAAARSEGFEILP